MCNKLKVLFIGNEDFKNNYEKYININNTKLKSAGDFKLATSLIEKNRYDLIVLDPCLVQLTDMYNKFSELNNPVETIINNILYKYGFDNNRKSKGYLFELIKERLSNKVSFDDLFTHCFPNNKSYVKTCIQNDIYDIYINLKNIYLIDKFIKRPSISKLINMLCKEVFNELHRA